MRNDGWTDLDINNGRERVFDFLHNHIVVGAEFGRRRLGVDELGVLHLLQHVRQGGLDVRPRDTLFRGRVGDRLLGLLVQGDDALQHADGLGQRAHVIVLGEGILVEEIFDDDIGQVHDDLLILRQGLLAHQLHDLLQVVLLGEDFLGAVLEAGVGFVVVLVEEGFQHAHVLGVGDVPVDRREVLALGQL